MLEKGQQLVHERRGLCEFVSIDEQDPSGGTLWVKFDKGDEAEDEVMVSTALCRKVIPCPDDKPGCEVLHTEEIK